MASVIFLAKDKFLAWKILYMALKRKQEAVLRMCTCVAVLLGARLLTRQRYLGGKCLSIHVVVTSTLVALM